MKKPIKLVLIVAIPLVVFLAVLASLFVYDKQQTEVGGVPVEETRISGDSLIAQTVEEAALQGEVKALTEAQFSKLVADYATDPMSFIGEKPCLVDFYATWCGPCKRLSPIVEKMAGKYAGKIDFYKIDVDNAAELSQTYGIESIPTLFFCSNGKIETMVGAPSEEELDKKLSELR